MFFFNLKLRSRQNGFLKVSLTSDERREKVSVGIRCDDLWCCAFDDLMRSSSSSNVHLVASALGNHSQPVATRLYVAMLHKSINNFTFCMYRFWGSAAREFHESQFSWHCLPLNGWIFAQFSSAWLFWYRFIIIELRVVNKAQKCRSCLPFEKKNTKRLKITSTSL